MTQLSTSTQSVEVRSLSTCPPAAERESPSKDQDGSRWIKEPYTVIQRSHFGYEADNKAGKKAIEPLKSIALDWHQTS